MKNPATTLTLLILIILAMAWKSGVLQRVLNAAFGSEK